MGRDPKGKKSISEELKESIAPVFERGEVETVQDGDRLTLRLKRSGIGHSSENYDIIEKVNDTLASKSAIAEFQEFIKSRGFEETIIEEEQKRIYRKKTEFPDPSKPRWASVNRTSNNRTKKEVKLRLPPDVLDVVNEAAEKRGQDRTSWMTEVFLRAAQEDGFELSPELQEILDSLGNGPD